MIVNVGPGGPTELFSASVDRGVPSGCRPPHGKTEVREGTRLKSRITTPFAARNSSTYHGRMAQTEHIPEEHLIIIGLGLIGGSIAAAYRKRFPSSRVTAIGRSAERLEKAREQSLITDFATSATSEILTSGAFVVVCLPVDMIADAVSEIAELSNDSTVITDAGSVKETICKSITANPVAAEKFVGSHPIAGGENGGFEFADADLFVDRTCVITPTANAASVDRVSNFWESIGCDTIQMLPQEHDRVLALTSHLPHVAAAATAAAVGEENLSLCGSGFRDATRIAAGNAALWKAILTENREAVLAALEKLQRLLDQYRAALQTNDEETLQRLLAEAAAIRNQLD